MSPSEYRCSADDASPGPGKRPPEGLREPDAVVAPNVDEKGGRFRPEGFRRETGEHLALKVVGEAHAENVGPDPGDLGIRRRRRDHGDLARLRDRGRRQGAGGSRFADESDDVVARDQLRHRRGGLGRLSSVVLDFQGKGFSQDASPGVDLVERERDSLLSRLAERGRRSGERAVEADRNPFSRGTAGLARERKGKKEQETSAHGSHGRIMTYAATARSGTAR